MFSLVSYYFVAKLLLYIIYCSDYRDYGHQCLLCVSKRKKLVLCGLSYHMVTAHVYTEDL